MQKLLVHHILYLMHIEKNVCESIFGALLDIKDKSKDGKNSRDDLQHVDGPKKAQLSTERQPDPKVFKDALSR